MCGQRRSKMKKITIEEEGKETIVLECDAYLLAIADKLNNGILRTMVGYFNLTYIECCRLLTTTASEIHKDFTALVKRKE
jgi:hypothetical protein